MTKLDQVEKWLKDCLLEKEVSIKSGNEKLTTFIVEVPQLINTIAGIILHKKDTYRINLSVDVFTEKEEVAAEEVAAEEVAAEEVNFDSMSKKAIDEWASDKGIDLDRRKSKSEMIETLKAAL